MRSTTLHGFLPANFTVLFLGIFGAHGLCNSVAYSFFLFSYGLSPLGGWGVVFSFSLSLYVLS